MMSNQASIARPYAKAIFEIGLAEKTLPQWSSHLAAFRLIISDLDVMNQVVHNPHVCDAQRESICLNLLSELSANATVGDEVVRWVRLLIRYKRLVTVPAIAEQFELLRAEYDQSITVEVISQVELSQQQERQLIQKMEQRLNRRVILNKAVDITLLGGAVIRAHDLVIDGSLRGQLNKLSADLAV